MYSKLVVCGLNSPSPAGGRGVRVYESSLYDSPSLIFGISRLREASLLGDDQRAQKLVA